MWLPATLVVGALLVPVLWELLSALPLGSHWAGFRADVISVFYQAEGQWQSFAVLFSNACAWAGIPVFLRWRRSGEPLPLDEWALFGLLGLVGSHYALRYETAAGSTDALMLLAGIWGACLWRILAAGVPVRPLLSGLWLGAFVLALGSLGDWPLFQVFRYRDARRATGLWTNPNTYGLLAGCLSAAGVAWLLRLAPWRSKTGALARPVPHRPGWLLLLPLVPALMGLVRSYSRGAWLGFGVALAWCGWWQFGPVLQSLRSRAKSGEALARLRWRMLRFLAVALLGGGLVALWCLKDFQNPLLRRIGTVANHTDRSWRNRVDAWIGAARMTVVRPLTGWGLNRVEAAYAREFKPAHLRETAAI